MLWYDIKTSNPYDFFNKLWEALVTAKTDSVPLRTKDEIEEKDIELTARTALIDRYAHHSLSKLSKCSKSLVFLEKMRRFFGNDAVRFLKKLEILGKFLGFSQKFLISLKVC